MQHQPSLFTRDDTFLGVCAGLGEDFGFNPIYLRATLAGLLLWQPLAVLGIYASLGLIVLASRTLYPNARKATPSATVSTLRADGRTQAREDEQVELADAA